MQPSSKPSIASRPLVLLAALLVGCTEPTEPTAAVVEVHVATSGAVSDVDPDGYSLLFGETVYPIPANGMLTIPDIAFGTHRVSLEGVAANCSDVIVGPQLLSVPEYRQEVNPRVSVFVTCSSNRGTLRITTETSGSDPDPNGYVVTLHSNSGAVGGLFVKPTGTTQGVFPSGNLKINVDGIADNCRIEGERRETVTVEHARFLDLKLHIVCAAKGFIAITANTLDPYPDSDGYGFIVLRNGQPYRSQRVAANATAMVSDLTAGDYEVVLEDVAMHCAPPPKIAAAVRSGEIANVVFEVRCETPFEIAYVAGTGNQADITVVNTAGGLRRVVSNEFGPDLDPAWSPDGRRIAFTKIRVPSSRITVMDADGGNRTELTSGPGLDQRAAWSPDGKRIAFTRHLDGNSDIYVMNADGSDQRRVTEDPALDTDPAWSPDLKKIAFARLLPDQSASIYVMNADGSGVTRLTSGSSDHAPAWSPDGARIVFARRRSADNWNIQLMGVSGDNVVALVAGLLSAGDPVWSPDGKAIAFSGERDTCQDYWYYYYCVQQIYFAKLDGTVTTLREGTYIDVSSPSWRPRP